MKTVANLIADLQRLDPEKSVMILDGSNGGGLPREINLGPTCRYISIEDVEECADCENVADSYVYVLGFGCY